MKLEMHDIYGNVVEEKEIKLAENDILVMKYDKNLTLASISKIFEIVSSGLEMNKSLIAVPNAIEFEVIKVEK